MVSRFEIPKSLSRIRQYPLDEWLAPRLTEIPLAPFWVIAVVFCGLLLMRWRTLREASSRQLAILCLPALATLPLALSAVRNVGPFLMLAAPAVSGLMPRAFFAPLADRRRLIWFEPDQRVFLDGRQDPYQPSLVLDQIRVESSGDYAPTFSAHGIRCAYLPVISPVPARLSASGWSTLYRDSAWVVLSQ